MLELVHFFRHSFKKVILESFCNLEHVNYDDDTIKTAMVEGAVLAFDTYRELIVAENAMDMVDYISKLNFKELKFNEDLYCKLNEIITQGSRDQDVYGQYRSVNVEVKALGVLPPPDYNQVNKLVESLNDLQKQIEPKEHVAKTMVELMKLQPFENGNKRTALFLANCALIKNKLGIIYFDKQTYPDFREHLIDFYEFNDKSVVDYVKEKCIYEVKELTKNQTKSTTIKRSPT